MWKTNVEGHRTAVITGAPTLEDDVLYVPVSSSEEVFGASLNYQCCSFRGSVVALDAATGKIRWQARTIPQEPQPVRQNASGVQLWGPSGAPVWSSPTVDLIKRRIYVTTGDNYSDPPSDTSDAFLAFDMHTGALIWTRRIVWDIDTKQDYATVNGVPARGGSLDGPGAVVVDGTLYVNSGYSNFGTIPGNVLLAFSVDGK